MKTTLLISLLALAGCTTAKPMTDDQVREQMNECFASGGRPDVSSYLWGAVGSVRCL